MADYESTLQDVLLRIAKKLNYERAETTIKKISSEGANYTSELFEATILAPGCKKLDVFGKVAAVEEETRNASVTSENIYITEIYCYRALLKKYQDMEEEFNVPQKHRLAIAKFYGGSDEYLKETVVLENLNTRGYETYDRLKSMDWKFAAESVKQLAKFHALSIAFSVYDPEGFEDTKEVLKTKFNLDGLSAMAKNVLNNALEVVNVENKQRLAVYIQNRIKAEDFGDFLKPVRRSMIIHGDYRLSNLMYKYNDNGVIKVIPLDYQNIRHGSPLVDFFYFIFTGSNKKFRDAYYTSAVELYYTELCDSLRRLYVDPEDVYSRDDFDYEYKKFLSYGLEISVFMLFLITVDAGNENKDRGLSAFAEKPNDLYKERINDIVEDYIRMGLL